VVPPSPPFILLLLPPPRADIVILLLRRRRLCLLPLRHHPLGLVILHHFDGFVVVVGPEGRPGSSSTVVLDEVEVVRLQGRFRQHQRTEGIIIHGLVDVAGDLAILRIVVVAPPPAVSKPTTASAPGAP